MLILVLTECLSLHIKSRHESSSVHTALMCTAYLKEGSGLVTCSSVVTLLLVICALGWMLQSCAIIMRGRHSELKARKLLHKGLQWVSVVVNGS